MATKTGAPRSTEPRRRHRQEPGPGSLGRGEQAQGEGGGDGQEGARRPFQPREARQAKRSAMAARARGMTASRGQAGTPMREHPGLLRGWPAPPGCRRRPGPPTRPAEAAAAAHLGQPAREALAQPLGGGQGQVGLWLVAARAPPKVSHRVTTWTRSAPPGTWSPPRTRPRVSARGSGPGARSWPPGGRPPRPGTAGQGILICGPWRRRSSRAAHGLVVGRRRGRRRPGSCPGRPPAALCQSSRLRASTATTFRPAWRRAWRSCSSLARISARRRIAGLLGGLQQGRAHIGGDTVPGVAGDHGGRP